MKAIHWTPIENKDSILKNGINIKDTWLSCSVLTPFKNLNQWWLDFSLDEGEYLGCIFELKPIDFPLVYCHWAIDAHKEYNDNFEELSVRRFTLEEILDANPKNVYSNFQDLKKGYKETIIWRIGNVINIEKAQEQGENEAFVEADEMLVGLNEIAYNKDQAIEKYFDNPDFMEFVFEDYELLLFKDIEPARIEDFVVPNSDYGYSRLMNEIKKCL